ncbi:MAG: glycoside hydrolase, partial [Verrucomicrobiae bacterium]|nr:glycoside hydrolase [Verrucomicrobiae bacterium]
KTTVWLDDREIGSDLSLSTPHVYDLGTVEETGRHVLTVQVDNSMVIDIGENSHSVSDHTQGNWNGIVGKIQLEGRSPVWLEDIRIFPDVQSKRIQVKALLRNRTGRQAKGKISLDVNAGPEIPALKSEPISLNFDTPSDAQEVNLVYSLGENAQLWDEFSPAVYHAQLTLGGEVGGQSFAEESDVTFGLRMVSHDGNQLRINGRKLFLRGTLECAIFPKTGHPPTDVQSWRKVYRAAKAHGLNHLRFHSWCPPEAAFIAADEMGVYLQVEAASWPNQSTTLGDGKPVDTWLEAEAKRILAAYGNHPSFIMMASGNEPGGPNHAAWLTDWVTRRQREDPRRFYTSSSGWPELPVNDYHVTPKPRIQAWGQELDSRINALPPETRTDYRDFMAEREVPVVAHEIGEWCVYPNFDEIVKYTGYLKPKNFEIFRDWLVQNYMGDQARDFLMASGKLQALCYKEDIESALRTPTMGGFQLLDLHDFPGQG